MFLVIFNWSSVNTIKLDKAKVLSSVKSLPNRKNLDRSKLKAFVEDKIDVPEGSRLVLGKVKNVGKEKEHFLLFSQCFQSRLAHVR